MPTDTLIEKRPISEAIYKESCRYIPQGVNSPVRAFPGLEEAPLVVERGVGAEIIDADDNRYVDYCCSWGALILGHAHPDVVGGVSERLARGSSFGITTEIEARLARKVVEILPSIEKLRFVSSGTEACMSALRLARGVTGRQLVVKFTGCYHGHADPFLVQAGSGLALYGKRASSAGVPEAAVKHTVCLPYNDCEAVSRFFEERGQEIAAVFVEPIAGNMGVVPGTEEFLLTLRRLTQTAGALLVFDEVINGFRVGLTGAQGKYGISPDLTCLGKVVGGGFPAAAFGGRAELMDALAPEGAVYQAGTLSGNPVAMEAGWQTLELLQAPGFYESLEEKAALLLDPVKQFIADNDLNACIQDVGSMFTLFLGRRSVGNISETQQCQGYEKLFSYLLARGIYFPPSQYEACFITAAHSEEQLKATGDSLIAFLSTL